ncbi:MAG: hypothetical protein V3T08_09770 [Gemmatimonadota bacterium]
MAKINPFAGLRIAGGGLQITNGKAPRVVLRSRGTVGLDQRLGRRIRTGHRRIPIKPLGNVVRGPISAARVQPLTDAQLNVQTVRAGVGAHSRTKIW